MTIGKGNVSMFRRRSYTNGENRSEVSMEEGRLYLVKETKANLSVKAFAENLNGSRPGMVLSRANEAEFRSLCDSEYRFLWLSESGEAGAVPPDIEVLKERIEALEQGTVLMFDRMDYLVFVNGFKQTLTFIHWLRDLAYLRKLTVIISMDARVLNSRELHMLEKEVNEVEMIDDIDLSDDLVEILKYVARQYHRGRKPKISEIGHDLGLSKPTIRKRINLLSSADYIDVRKNGRCKLVVPTEMGLNIGSA